MPRPAYIVCSKSGSVDQFGNNVSCFEVIETLHLRRVEGEQETGVGQRGKPFTMRVVATWMREDGDGEEQEFESQFVGHFPGHAEEIVLGDFPAFRFTNPFHRLFIAELQLPGFFGLGVFVIESRVRRAGEAEWQWRQSFPIRLDEMPAASPDGQQQ